LWCRYFEAALIFTVGLNCEVSRESIPNSEKSKNLNRHALAHVQSLKSYENDLLADMVRLLLMLVTERARLDLLGLRYDLS
jgi:hypothetical protein